MSESIPPSELASETNALDPSTPESGVAPVKTTRASWTILLLVLLGVTVFKLSMLESVYDLPRKGDQLQYLAGSRAVYRTGVPEYTLDAWDEAHSSPLYPYAIGGLRHFFDGKQIRKPVLGIQAVLSTLTALLIFLIARRLFGPRSALISAIVVALLPTFIAYSQCFLTETIYTFLFVAVIALLICAPEGPMGRGRAVFAGLIGGLAALTKSQFVVLSPFIVLWLLVRGGRERRAAVLSAAAFLVGLGLVVAPWSVRNTLRYDHFLMVDTNPGNVLYKNWNVLTPENHDVGMYGRWADEAESYAGEVPMRPRSVEPNIAAKNSAEVKAAIAFVFAQPGIFLRNSWVRAQALFNPTSFLVRMIRDGNYVPMSKTMTEVVVWLTLLSTGFVLAFGVLGLTTIRPTVGALLPLFLVIGCVALSVLIISTSRYRFPMMPLLIIFAVEGARRLPSLVRKPSPGLLVAVPILAVMVAAFIRYVPLSL